MAKKDLKTMVAEYPKDVGRALADYRQRAGLTLQHLSDVTGVSVGTLSKLENDKAMPSFRTLMRIIQHLDLSGSVPGQPAEAASGVTARKTTTRKGEALIARSDKGDFQIHAAELLNKEMFPMTATITLHVAPPIENWTRHPGDEFVYVLEGEIEVYVEHYRPYVVKQGESTYYDSGMRHVLISRGPEDAVVLSVSTSSQADGVKFMEFGSPPGDAAA